MSKVVYFGEKTETVENVDFSQWLLNRWPHGTVPPRGLQIFKNETNITHEWFVDPSVLADPDATYYLYEVPAGGALGGIMRLVGAILKPILKLFGTAQSPTGSVKNTRNPSSNNALQGRTNTSRPGERIADIRGMVRSFPDLLMDYRIFRGGSEYEVQFLCVGEGEYQLEDIRDGITPASNISGEQLAFYKNGAAPGFGDPYMQIGGGFRISDFPIVVAQSSNEADGTEVLPPNYADLSRVTFRAFPTGNIVATPPDENTTIDWGTRAPTGSTVRLVDFYSFEPHPTLANVFIRHDVSGLYRVNGSGGDTLLLDIGSTFGWGAFPADGQTIYDRAYERPDGFWQFQSGVETRLRRFSPSCDSTDPYTVGPYLLESADKIQVNLYAQNGVYKSNGDIFKYEAAFVVILSDPDQVLPSVFHSMLVQGRFTEAVGETLIVPNPFNGPVNVSVRRLTDTDKNFEGNVVDAVVWRDLYAVRDISPRSYGNLTLVHAVTRATNAAIKQKEKKLNMLATRVYNGVASSNFADVIMSMHTSPLFGRRTLATIDRDGLYRVQQQLLDYFGNPQAIQCGYTFDNTNTTYEEGLQIICNAVNVTAYQVGSVISFWPDLPQVSSAMQFGHAFKVPGTDRRTRTFSPQRSFTGVQVKYYDHKEHSYLYVNKGEQNNVNKIELLACQSRYLAEIRANREFNKLRYQRITHETVTQSIGLQAAPMMRVDMVDNTRLKQSEGTVEAVDGLTLHLSDPIVIIPGASYSITLTGRLGTIENIPITIVDEFIVTMTRQPTVDVYTGWLRDKTAYVVRADDQRSKLAMLVEKMQPSARDNNYTVSLTCINYDDRYYQDDK